MIFFWDGSFVGSVGCIEGCAVEICDAPSAMVIAIHTFSERSKKLLEVRGSMFIAVLSDALLRKWLTCSWYGARGVWLQSFQFQTD
jgi:hypothetical protein